MIRFAFSGLAQFKLCLLSVFFLLGDIKVMQHLICPKIEIFYYRFLKGVNSSMYYTRYWKIKEAKYEWKSLKL